MRIMVSFVLFCATSWSWAVTTSSWVQRAADDFGSGTMREVVVASHGELRLSRSTQPLIKDDPRLDVVYCLAQTADGTTLIGTGPEGVILRRSKTGEVTQLYAAGPDTLVTAMQLQPDGQLLAGISGRKPGLVRINLATGESKALFSPDDLQFIWGILLRPDGNILLATGPTGKLIEVSPESKPRVVLTSKQHNLTHLMADKGDDVIIGTDPDALVLRVNVKTGEWFVLYDAGESEVAALAHDGEGNIYVAAALAAEVSGREQPPSAGRSRLSPDVPLRREPAAAPQPPALPNPSPGEPEPIPKKAVPSQRLRILDTDPQEGDVPTPPQTQPTKTPTQAMAAALGTEDTEGSMAVYRISPSGFVTEVLRRSGTVYCMLWTGKSLLLGTGSQGQVLEYRPGDDECTALWRSDSHQVSAMAMLPDASVLLGLSNPGMLVQMGGGYASKGTLTSDALDAAQVARFGKLQLDGTLPARTAVTVASRSGNTSDPDAGGWSAWSDEMPAAEFIPISSPPARFLQYRLTLSTQAPDSTPTIEQVKANYIVPNIAPKVNSVEVEPVPNDDVDAGKKAPPARSPASYTIKWEASDANSDRLVYALHYRLGHQGPWILLKDKLTETSYIWETRKMADGRYQVRVTASDEQTNPVGEGKTGSRFSDPVMIDNTPPVIGDLKSVPTKDGAEISLRVVDRTGTVAGVDYAVDARDDWQAAYSSDMLYDSPDETVKFVVTKLAAGPHQVTIRAADAAGNTAYETLIITVQDR